MKKSGRRLWVLVLPVVLLLCFLKALLFPEEKNAYENRYAYRWRVPTVQTVEKGTFQNSVENALTDQIPLSGRIKAAYNSVHTGVLKTLLQPVWNAHPDRYFTIGDMRIFGGDYIIYPAKELASVTEALDAKAQNLNAAIANHPELEFYVYYIEKDTDIQFETGEKVGAGEYLFHRLSLDSAHTAIFSVNSFDEFSKMFYRTDHHWNCDGSYLGYVRLSELLQLDTVLQPEGEKTCIGTFSGAKATSIGGKGVFREDFYAYKYGFPAMTITVDGEERDYGNQESFWNGTEEEPDYGAFYGKDNAEVIFDTGSDTGENFLVIGDSFDNAILKLLAASFDRIYAIDLRYYSATFGEAFNLGDYTRNHNIGKVLLMGNIDYYTMADFMLEG